MLISTKSNPASSARTAWATSSWGENASANSLYPIFTGSSLLARSLPYHSGGGGNHGCGLDNRRSRYILST